MFVGLDLGTSGLRALLTDENGQPVGSVQSPYQTSHPHVGWSEQDPALWVRACEDVFAQLVSDFAVQLSELEGIGISGHMHGAVLLDENQQILRECILWNDTRSHVQAAELDGISGVRELSGNIVFPGFTAPKLKWVAENEPEIFARTKTVLLPKDYLRFWLTGELRSEMSDAAGTSWLDVGARQWSETLIAASGVDSEMLSALVEGSSPAGSLRSELLTKWGIAGDVVVAGGAADNAAAACGAGILGEGQGFVSLGTSGVILAGRDGYAPKPERAVHTFCHAVPNRWYQMGVTLAATDSLNWLSGLVGQTPNELTDALGADLSAPTSISFLPYLSGERTPHNDSAIRGAFLGLDIAHSNLELTQAVLQGVSFSLRESLDALRATGAQMPSLLAMGGGTKSEYWVKMLATILNTPIDVPEQGDFGAALGAARLAICAATGADAKSVMTSPTIARTITPNNELVAAYDAAYQKFQQIYPAVKAVQ